MKVLIHKMPAALGEIAKPVSEINSEDFDFRGHFEKESIARLGRFLICMKTKPWTRRDLMVIDASDNFARSISDLDEEDKDYLGKIISKVTGILKKDPETKKIIIGANINPFDDFGDDESIFRLHMHICALSQGEINKMSQGKTPPSEEILEEFKKDFTEVDKDFVPYEFGIKKELNFSELLEEIAEADLKIKKLLNSYKKRFKTLAYSFACVVEGSKRMLYISPKYFFGGGVLESFGVILKREKNLKIDKEFVKIRNKFLEYAQNEILKIPGAEKGKFRLEEK